MKIGVFGGTFNPIHNAHINLAKQFLTALKLDKILIVPTFVPPHKEAKNLAQAQARLDMCGLAIGDIAQFELCDYEIKKSDTSYTYQTLEHLKKVYPEDSLYLLMGSDMFLTLQEWKNPRRIMELAYICAGSRSKGEYLRITQHKPFLEKMGARCIVVGIEPVEMSSTEIRDRIKSKENMQVYLPQKVMDYIEANSLYGE